MSGKQFLASEPYPQGVATIATVVERSTTRTRLLLAFPADDYTIDLVVDDENRIQTETLTTARNLVQRTFEYP